jgi:hypothetical protein
MAVQDTSHANAIDDLALADPHAGKHGRRMVRSLPVQKDWPTWLLLCIQIGILVGGIAFWEMGANLGFNRQNLLVAANRDLQDPNHLLHRRRRLD